MRSIRFTSLWYVWHKPCTYITSRLALSAYGLKELPLESRPLGVPSGTSKTIFEPILRSAQTVHLYCNDTDTISKWTEIRFHMTHPPRSSIGCIQDDCWAYGTLGTNCAPILCQEWHYLQTDSNELPLEPRNLEVPSVASNFFLSLWYIRRKPSYYLALTLTLSPNRTERDSIWPTSPRSSIGCIQNDFPAYGRFGATHAPSQD
jgi:hypothetical protein